jgi:hypothetical protein
MTRDFLLRRILESCRNCEGSQIKLADSNLTMEARAMEGWWSEDRRYEGNVNGLRLTMLIASSGAVGEGVGAAEVLGYFWDAENF